MTFAPGSRLGPYEIVEKIGEGGMGAVYKARDSRLGRAVAVKVLRGSLVATADQRARFDREARAISSLSHPHICALFDVGREGETDFLVMEYLDGESLADRLVRGKIALDQALRWGIQIAQALAQAHRQGIVHRDLKPGNILLTSAGVKLLDFGLAKIQSSTPASPQPQSTPPPYLSRSAIAAEPTVVAHVHPLTSDGMLIGTPQYMSPEQLAAGEVDSRADLWALGCVLYELVVGRRAFGGDSPQAVIAAIFGAEPQPFPAESSTPPALERLIRGCLVKDREARWQNAFDVALALEGIAGSDADSVPAVSRPRLSWWSRLALGAGLLLAGFGVGAWLRNPPPAAAPAGVKFEVPPPPGEEFASGYDSLSLAVSPDGRRLSYVAVGGGSATSRIWVRQLDELVARPLPGTEGARSPMWSPDGRSLAFAAGGKLKRLELAGGAAVTLCGALDGDGFAGSWGTADQIVFSTVQGEAIYRVPASGGEPEKVIEPDESRGEVRTKWPWYLPDGRRFLYLARDRELVSRLMLADPGKPSRVVGPLESRVELGGPDQLLFARDGVLLAQRFDAASARLVDAPLAVAPAVRFFFSAGWAAFAASPTGTIVLLSEESTYRLTWVDRRGRALGAVGPAGGYLSVALAPDGRSVLVDRMQPDVGSYDLWKIDLERAVETRLTSARGADIGPVWLPDGKAFVYSSQRSVGPNLVRRELATDAEQDLLPRPTFQLATSVSRDGKKLLFRERGEDGQPRAWVLELERGLDEGTGAQPLTASQGREDQMRLSPDGAFFAYLSDESGSAEAYVSSLANRDQKVRISTRGASHLRWSHDGREIFLLTPERQMLAVPVATLPRLAVGTSEVLFSLPVGTVWQSFDVDADANRFLAVVRERSGGAQPATAILNWRAGPAS